MVDRMKLSYEQAVALREDILQKGYLPREYTLPKRTIETQLRCPLCKNTIFLTLYGNSRSIQCHTDNCFKETTRGL